MTPNSRQRNSAGMPEASGGSLSRFSHDKRMLALRYMVGPRTIQGWVSRRVIPFVRIGNVLRFDPEACDRALDRRSVNPAPLEPRRKDRPSKPKAAASSIGTKTQG